MADNHHTNQKAQIVKETYRSLVLVKSITMADGNRDSNWDWRLKNVGKHGAMTVYTFLDGKHSGKSVVKISGEAFLQTSPGEFKRQGDIITLTTQQTIYVFELTGMLPAFLAGCDTMTKIKEEF